MTSDSGSDRVKAATLRVLVLVVVVAAIAVVVASVAVIKQANRLDSIERRMGNGSLEQAAADADAGALNRHLSLVTPDTRQRLDVVVTPKAAGFTTGGTLADAGNDRRYQLWASVSGQFVSLGLIGNDVTVASAFRLPTGTTDLMLSNEAATGAVVPAQPFVASAKLPA